MSNFAVWLIGADCNEIENSNTTDENNSPIGLDTLGSIILCHRGANDSDYGKGQSIDL